MGVPPPQTPADLAQTKNLSKQSTRAVRSIPGNKWGGESCEGRGRSQKTAALLTLRVVHDINAGMNRGVVDVS